jgi:hypothetical protein
MAGHHQGQNLPPYNITYPYVPNYPPPPPPMQQPRLPVHTVQYFLGLTKELPPLSGREIAVLLSGSSSVSTRTYAQCKYSDLATLQQTIQMGGRSVPPPSKSLSQSLDPYDRRYAYYKPPRPQCWGLACPYQSQHAIP